jgi:hypothetical protein
LVVAVVVVVLAVMGMVTALVVVVVLMLHPYCRYQQGQAILLWLVLAVLLAQLPMVLHHRLAPLWWLLLQVLMGGSIVAILALVVRLPLQQVPLNLLVVAVELIVAMLVEAVAALEQLQVPVVPAAFPVMEILVELAAKLVIPQLLQLVQVLVPLVMGAREEMMVWLEEMPWCNPAVVVAVVAIVVKLAVPVQQVKLKSAGHVIALIYPI